MMNKHIYEKRSPGDRFAITSDGSGTECRHVAEPDVLSLLSSAGIFSTEPATSGGVTFLSFEDLYRLTLNKEELLALSAEIRVLAEKADG
jgi:hypothetical protein